MLACLTVALLQFYGCSADIAGPSKVRPTTTVAAGMANAGSEGSVDDLRATAATDWSVTLSWRQVDDGRGSPARYRVKYAETPIDWSSAATGCNQIGTTIGSTASCTIPNLKPNRSYDVQLMSYRVVNGEWVGALYSNVTRFTTSSVDTLTVRDLLVSSATDASLTVRWTQIDDGTGGPASYRVKYAVPPFNWSAASVGCASTITGTSIGTEMSCTIDGLSADAAYDLQLMSFRPEQGVWTNARYSNGTQGATVEPGGATWQAPGNGMWITQDELSALPTSGPAWNKLLQEADRPCGTVDLADQAQTNNVCVLANALVFARTGLESYRSDVIRAIREIARSGTYSGRALALGRELGAYVIAADLIDLPGFDPALDEDFRAKLRELLWTYTSGASSSLVDCHEHRPNNWGAMCGGSRAAVAVYLGDAAELARVAQVFKGFLGDRSAYADFKFGELSWQCDPNRPVPINPAGCWRYGRDFGGVLADDQRRGGSFSWPPPRENYVWESMQGILVQAVILERAGYPAFDWEDQAILRAAQWLHDRADYPAEGDDTWQPHVLNYYYGTSFPAPVPSRPGKNMGWTDWTHGG